MFSTLAFAPLVAFFAAQAVHGDATPTAPGGSDVFKAGSDCTTSWTGDNNATSLWKSMDIELMSGDNFHMVHVTTVATGQDGTKDGKFTFTCPEVDPYSAIYFYQFSAVGASPAWTTRFTIASPNGDTVPPANQIQPPDSKGVQASIPWGVGKLVDQSKVVPPPPSAGGTTGTSAGSSSSSSSTTPVVAGTTTSAATVGETTTSASASPSSTSSRFVTSTTGSAGAASTGTSSSSSASSSGAPNPNDNAALGNVAGGWKYACMAVVSALGFAVLL